MPNTPRGLFFPQFRHVPGLFEHFLDVWQPEVDSQEATTHQLERYTESWPVTK